MIATSGFHPTRDPDAPHASRAAPTADCICWRPIGDEASGPGAAQYPIYIRQRAVAALHDHFRASPQQGVLGFLIGAMLEDPLTRERWLEIEFIVRLTQAIYGDKTTLVISRVWERLQQEVGRTGGHMLGWYHTHPPLGVEIAPGDIEAHEQYFGRPWHVALLLGQNASGPLGAFYRPSAGLPLGTTPLPFFEIVSRDSITPEGRRRTRVTWKNYKPDLKRTTGAVTGLSAVLQALQTPATNAVAGPTPLPRMTTPPRGSAAIRATPPVAPPAPNPAPSPRAASTPPDIPLPPPPVPPPVAATPVASPAPERMRTPPRGSPAVRVPTPLPRRVPTPVAEPVAVVQPPSAPAAPEPPVTVTFTPAPVLVPPPPLVEPVAAVAQPREPTAPAPTAPPAPPAPPAAEPAASPGAGSRGAGITFTPAADPSSAAVAVTFVPAPTARPRPAPSAEAAAAEAEPLPPQLRESPPGPPPRQVSEPPAREPPARAAPAREPPPAAATDQALDHLAAREKRPSAAVQAAIRVSSEVPLPPVPRTSRRRSVAGLEAARQADEAPVARAPFVVALLVALAGAVWWFVVRPPTAEAPAASAPVQPTALESTAAPVDSPLVLDTAGGLLPGSAAATVTVPDDMAALGATAVPDAMAAFDAAMDSVTIAIEAYRESARGWEDGERDCEALSGAYVAQSDRWLIYNRVRRPLSLDAARRARDQRALAAADSIDDHFRQSGCPRP